MMNDAALIVRVNRMEAQLRTAKLCGAALLLFGTACLVGGQSRPFGDARNVPSATQSVVVARALFLVDEKGRTRVGLAAGFDSAGDCGLVLYDEHEKPRASIVVSGRGTNSSLKLSSTGALVPGQAQEGKPSPDMSAELVSATVGSVGNALGSVRLTFRDHELTADALLRDRDRIEGRISLGLFQSTLPGVDREMSWCNLRFNDEKGKSRASIGHSVVGTTMGIHDSNGRPRAAMLINAPETIRNGQVEKIPEVPSVVVRDDEGEVKWVAP